MENETDVIYIHPQKRIVSQKESIFILVLQVFFSFYWLAF